MSLPILSRLLHVMIQTCKGASLADGLVRAADEPKTGRLGVNHHWGNLVIVDTRTEAAVQRDHNGPIGAPATAPATAGRVGARAGRLGWGVGQPLVVSEYRALINCIFDLEWTHGDRRIVLACGDGKCRVQDVETSAEVLVLSGHSGSVKAISANPLEHSVLLSGSRDGSFALWDTRLHQDKPESRGLHRTTAAEYMALATGPANRLQNRFLAPLEQVYRANIPAGNHRKRPWSYVGEAEANPAKSKNFHLALPCQSSVTAVEWMPDGQKFLTAGQDGLVKGVGREAASGTDDPRPPTGGGGGGGGGGGDRWRAYRRVSGGEAVAAEAAADGGRPYGVSSVHACDDGSRIAVCTVKNHISLYAYASGRLRHLGAFTGNENNSSYYIKAKLSPDGSLLASGGSNDAVCLWRVDCPGAPIGRLKGHANEVTGVDWCRSESLKLATCSDDETVRVWTLDPLQVEAHRKSSPAGATCRGQLIHRRAAAAATTLTLGWADPAEHATLAAGDSLSGGASERGEPGFGTRLDGGNDREYFATEGKFGRGAACIGESQWWRRRETGGASHPMMVAEDTLPRCTRETSRGSSSGNARGSDSGRSSAGVASMDLCTSPTSGSPNKLSSAAPKVQEVVGSRAAASGASRETAAWRGFSSAVSHEGMATGALGGRASTAVEFRLTVGSASTDVFSPCSPNKKEARVRPQASPEGAAAAGGGAAGFGTGPRAVGRRDMASNAENAAPPVLDDAPENPSLPFEIGPRSLVAALSAAESAVHSPARDAVKNPRALSRPGVVSAEAAILQQLAPPGGVADAMKGEGKPAGLDILRFLPSSTRAAGSGQHPTLMAFWKGAQGGSSNEAPAKAQGESDRTANQG
eukprot:jgi/Undpi1/2254/HiC_scaffold_13.g05640.m1